MASQRLEHLLLDLCRRDGEERLSDAELAFLAHEETRTMFFDLAVRHAVHGLVLTALDRPRIRSRLPTGVTARLNPSLRQLRGEAVLWELERDRLLTRLSQQGLEPVVLKGAALRCSVYAEPAQRHIGDIDLLLAEDEIEESLTALRTLGYRNPWPEVAIASYRQHHFHVRLVHSSQFKVELHWGLIRPGEPFQLDPRVFMRRATRARRANGAQFKIPSVEDTVLHMASQNLEDFFRLNRLVDIDRLIASSRSFDWDHLRLTAKEGRLEVVTALSLQLCRSLLGTAVPEDFISRLHASPAALWHLRLLRPPRWPVSPFSDGSLSSQIRMFWCIASWRGRLRMISRMLAGLDDPLKWIWDGHTAPAGSHATPIRGINSVVKLAAYQAWLYCRAVGEAIASGGRRRASRFRPAAVR